ncbi:MAG TPA: polysaccharide deacetylase family protein [Gemmatimonadaceae bacterium]
MSARPRISVIVPTFQRRDLVVRLVRALGLQRFDAPFEAVVVVDGSTDGTAEALGALDTAFPLRVLRQPNRGPARTRNHGAAAAAGEIFLFLDDDMEPDPSLLAEHDRSHRAGADAVTGVMPLHPDSPPTLLARGVGVWAEEQARRMSAPDYVPRFDEALTGQLSIRRDVFERLGGFDERFTAGGSYGNEDLDLAYRLLEGGYRVVHNPRAVSLQCYVVDAAAHLRQYAQAGEADVTFVRKHPDAMGVIFGGEPTRGRLHRMLRRPVLLAPRLAALAAAPLRRVIVPRVDRGHTDRLTTSLFFALRAVEYWRGVHRGGGIPGDHPLRVLCYHAIADLGSDAQLAPYGVPPDRFRAQLDTLRRSGYRFVAPEELVRYLDGRGGMPRRALLLTFDDCYRDLATDALPLLEERAIPAIAFAVTGCVGGINAWDQPQGARALPLLDADGLADAARRGVEIGAHSHTHRSLVAIGDEALCAEVAGSVERLRCLGHDAVRFYAYPYGEHDARARAAVRAAGVRAAFTTEPGRVRATDDPYRLRRVEVTREDVGFALRVKVATAGTLHDVVPRVRAWARVRTRLSRWLSGTRRAPPPRRDSREGARGIAAEPEIEP